MLRSRRFARGKLTSLRTASASTEAVRMRSYIVQLETKAMYPVTEEVALALEKLDVLMTELIRSPLSAFRWGKSFVLFLRTPILREKCLEPRD